MQVTASQGDTLDQLCWRHLGVTRNLVEEVLDLNPGIADAGPFLPEGTVINLPDSPPAASATLDTVRLWD